VIHRSVLTGMQAEVANTLYGAGHIVRRVYQIELQTELGSITPRGGDEVEVAND
jgi:hypothetical protein